MTRGVICHLEYGVRDVGLWDEPLIELGPSLMTDERICDQRRPRRKAGSLLRASNGPAVP
jgi:hypothetical protein